MRFPAGKLDPDFLAELLAANRIKDDRVAIGPAVGRDVCVVRVGDTCLALKSDPITFTSGRIGWYAVHVNANDVATVGARPRWFLVTALLPEGRTNEELVREIWDDLTAALGGLDCDLCGGHTEITPGLDRPILVGHMVGEVSPNRLVDKESVREGDRILLTKGIPVEGTAIMAREASKQLSDAFSEQQLRRARDFLDDPGISVVEEAMAAVEAGVVHAMHDPTEGGVATALWELAEAADCGMLVEAENIPLLQPGADFCRHLGLDPLGTIASGAMIICTPPTDAPAVAAAVRERGIHCTDIGEIRPGEEDAVLVRSGERMPMPVFAQDEITRLFG